jgi:adenylosuccinate synthase
MSSIKYIDVVVDGRYGDSGKGKLVYDLLQKRGHQMCIKVSGGPNAGHTIYRTNPETGKYQKLALHMLPVGIVKPDVFVLIGSECVVDYDKLVNEIEYIKSFDIDVTDRIFISKACHIITMDDIKQDQKNNIVGTTGCGIGPTYANKALRTGKRVEDLTIAFQAIGLHVVDMRHFWETPFVTSHINSVIIEGSQGFELDINWTANYPYCTSSTCTVASALNLGLPFRTALRDIVISAKAYDTYVGTRDFQPKDIPELDMIADAGHEYGTTTGRRRQCNYLNLDELITAVRINSGNMVIINKCDVLDSQGIYKLYHKNSLNEFENMDEMKKYITNVLNGIEGYNVNIIYSSSPYGI